MKVNHKWVDKILKAIFPLPEEQFGIHLYEDGEGEFDEFSDIKDKILEVDQDAVLNYGMSKMVISSPNSGGIVIKIPFNGLHLCRWNDEKDTDDIFWCPFDWAHSSDASDYCLSEYEKYNKMKAFGVDCFVTKTYFYKIIDGIRIFVQEYAVPIYNNCTKYKVSKQSQKIAKRLCDNELLALDEDWIANCVEKYGKSKVKKFLFYCRNIDPDILGDTHTGNYGYKRNGNPCFLDFSNFLEQTELY